MYVLGVDASLTSTGLAWLDTTEPEWLTRRVRTASPPMSTPAREFVQAERIDAIAHQVLDHAMVGGFDVDLVAIERLANYGRNAGALDLAGLWWRIVQLIGRNTDAELMVVATTTRAMYATGHGRADKHTVLAQVRGTYPDADVPNHDVADAVALAALGARVKGFPVEQVARPWVENVAAAVVARAKGQD